jgi:hypothetical protein
MASYLARRKFVATLGGAAAWRLAARAAASDAGGSSHQRHGNEFVSSLR